jgi:hypothetical protein
VENKIGESATEIFLLFKVLRIKPSILIIKINTEGECDPEYASFQRGIFPL